ncbi:MAG TPA: 3-hydroxyacyl-[acyl-carrier-protein] dehydratase FabZ, partial [Methyloceanibacter sp.]|nr:3-hydroxyacyl-[acyl-carrier-protein] dehydratase FabZ [Methyloceanibacter sp.]
MEASDIMKLLPHRYPFLLVDRIVDMDGDRSAIG